MSIGVVIAIDDTVLLVADGRRSMGTSVITDEAEKIVQLNQSLAVIEFGALMGSSRVVDQLRHSVTVSSRGDDVSSAIREGVHGAASWILSALIPGSANDMSRIKVGLLGGGIDAEGAYVCGTIFGHGMDGPASELFRASPGSPKFLILGGEYVGAREYFLRLAERALSASANDPAGLLVMFKRAAKKTVQYAAHSDRTIGGRVQFFILRRGGSPSGGFL